MISFNECYARYYDALYHDKDYAGEARFVEGRISEHHPQARTLIELGCGTARHARELVGCGYSVLGVDMSEQMIARALEECAQLPASQREKIQLAQGDVSRFRADTQFDVAISLFHVANYQVNSGALQGYFQTASQAVHPGGLFIFDFWYGPAVLADRPSVRIKRIETSDARITRLAEPTLDVNRNLVTVNYTLFARAFDGSTFAEASEQHMLRYLFLPELEDLAESTNFTLVETGEWLTRHALSDKTWYGYMVLRKSIAPEPRKQLDRL